MVYTLCYADVSMTNIQEYCLWKHLTYIYLSLGQLLALWWVLHHCISLSAPYMIETLIWWYFHNQRLYVYSLNDLYLGQMLVSCWVLYYCTSSSAQLMIDIQTVDVVSKNTDQLCSLWQTLTKNVNQIKNDDTDRPEYSMPLGFHQWGII